MDITLSSVIIDAAGPEPESAFWHRLLGGSLTRTPTHHFVQAPGFPVLVVQSAPAQVAPDWPDGAPQQMHLDLAVSDLAAADRVATAAGAARLRPTDDVAPHARQAKVYAGPAGHPFCLRPAQAG
ncbi:VOC family protein [Streptomyces sp. NPDC047002]|uniref:VOC family protein n=1 Tax=Streptomyces sp. NPDC047002 TaxID=3155475 RepID=UPI0034553724